MGLFLNSEEHGVAVFEDEGVDEKHQIFGMRETGSSKDRFRRDTLDGCEHDELGDAEFKAVKGFVYNNAVSMEK